MKDIPFFPVIPIVPIVLTLGSFVFSLLSMRRVRRLAGEMKVLSASTVRMTTRAPEPLAS
jgi:hypothetical protein